jgi:hypothetical protein
MACDEAELGPDGLARKMAAAREEQQREMARLRDQMQTHAAAMAPHEFASEVQARLGTLPPERIDELRRMAIGRAETVNAGLSDSDVMARAMDKITAARQMMQQAGLSETDVLLRAVEALRTGQLPAGLGGKAAQPSVETTQPGRRG